MFGIDDSIVNFSDGATVWIVVVVAILLGIRHAIDPDHIFAVATLAANSTFKKAISYGLMWGVGHSLTLCALGIQYILFDINLSGRVEQLAEIMISILIMYFSLQLLRKNTKRSLIDSTSLSKRWPFLVGTIHGIAGSGGASLLILATTNSSYLAISSLLLFVIFSTLSMACVVALFQKTIPATMLFRNLFVKTFGVISFSFGAWYLFYSL